MRLQFVFGSHGTFVRSATGASNWIAEGQVGSGRGWGFEERGSGRRVTGCRGCKSSPGKLAVC